jgi:hypothetical protein
MTKIASDHSRLDERSLALHRLVAEKIRHDPALLDLARGNLRRWRAASGGLSPALAEWDRILMRSAAEIAVLLVDPSENATRLRQSSPFAGILTEAERLAIYESYATRARHPGRQPSLG